MNPNTGEIYEGSIAAVAIESGAAVEVTKRTATRMARQPVGKRKQFAATVANLARTRPLMSLKEREKLAAEMCG